MRVAIYEWCVAGGCGNPAASIAAEGRLMLEALAADAVREPRHEVTVLVGMGREVPLPPRVRPVPVPAGADAAALVAAAQAADWTIVVAPETDGILCDLVHAVRRSGGRALAPGPSVLAVAADKQATVDALAARGVPVPAGRPLAAGEPLPPGFRLPAVRKARASCGGDGLEILATDDGPPAATPSRLECHVPGLPVGVSCICGAGATTVLPPLRQRFTAGAVPRYLGGDLLADEPLAARARTLARRAVAALGADAGWLGVDLILGDRGDGRDDRVLEVNPRITTSIVAHARLFETSLVAALISAAGGEPPTLRPVRTASGCGFRLPLDPPAPATCEPCPTPT